MSMQDVFLFSNTIDANIAYGNPDMSEEIVVDYAVAADADSFIKRMPDGYDTIIGERGVGLSGGQKQRIALARALAYETPVLILDDTTSAVDMETEKYIQSQLAARKGTHTTFIIAQRISSVKNADKIYIIENGKIYYAEIKFDEYLLYSITIHQNSPTYSSFPKDAYTGNEEDLVYATDEVLWFTPEYASIFEDKKSRLLQFFKDYDFELLDNGSIYSEKLKWLIFEYDGCVFQINLPENYEGSLDWQDIVEIKYVEVNK
jgi:ABC-type multidrug transport system ATPase subunit